MLRFIFKTLAAYMRDLNVTKHAPVLGGLRALDYLISFKDIANQLPLLPDWIPAHAAGRTFEVFSALGPFLSRTSVFPDADPAIAQIYFPAGNGYDGSPLGGRNRADVESGSNSLRDLFSSICSQLSKILGSLVRAGPEAKEGILAYFAQALILNKDRGKMQVCLFVIFPAWNSLVTRL
jgi:ubiquitin conjugation factor E4 B